MSFLKSFHKNNKTDARSYESVLQEM